MLLALALIQTRRLWALARTPFFRRFVASYFPLERKGPQDQNRRQIGHFAPAPRHPPDPKTVFLIAKTSRRGPRSSLARRRHHRRLSSGQPCSLACRQ